MGVDENMRGRFVEKYNYFVLFWFTITGLFNGLCILIVGSSKKILIDTILVMGLCFVSKKLRKISIKEILFISFYLFVTMVSLVFYFNNNHYGIVKLCKNVVLTTLVFSNFYVMYRFYKDEKFSLPISRLFLLQVLIELALYIFFILYNKKDGILGKTPVQLLVLQDWTGRFQGSFSEPSCLGLWLGIAIFIFFILYKNFLGYLVGLVFTFALYNACKAKFAMLALPIALIFSFFSRYSFSKSNSLIFFMLFFVCMISLFWHSFTGLFFSVIAKLFEKEGSATYVTRFGFLLSSMQNICSYPLGQGFGMNYERFQNLFTDIVPIAKGVNLETWELEGYWLDPNNMGSKETFSLLVTTFGFIGIGLYLSYFKNLLLKKYVHKFFAFSMIAFCFIESLITGNIMSDSAFFILLFAKMALNTDEEKNGL